MCENISSEDFNVCQQVAKELRSKSFGENYEISYQVSCTKLVVWISFEIYFGAVDKRVDTIKQLSVDYELHKFGRKAELVVKKFVTDYVDDDFSKLCTPTFYRK